MQSEPTIVIDTREKHPIVFPPRLATRHGTLGTGDYSVDGFLDCFTVERKSLADLVNTVIHDRERFARELERMRSYEFRRILVTAPFERVVRGPYPHSRANPKSVLASLAAFEVRYGVPIVFAKDEREAAERIRLWVHYFVREKGLGNASERA